MPTFQVVAPCHKDSVLNSAFASDYGDLMSNDRIDVWIHTVSYTHLPLPTNREGQNPTDRGCLQITKQKIEDRERE